MASCRASMLQMVRSTRMLSPSAETCPRLLATSLGEPSAIVFGETGAIHNTAMATLYVETSVVTANRRFPDGGWLAGQDVTISVRAGSSC